jgi:hypothetical protein
MNRLRRGQRVDQEDTADEGGNHNGRSEYEPTGL